MNKNLLLTMLIAVSVCSGCSRMKQFTRRDYALLEDPFTSELTEASVAERSPAVDSGAAGTLRLGSLGEETSQAVADYGKFVGAGAEESANTVFSGANSDAVGSGAPGFPRTANIAFGENGAADRGEPTEDIVDGFAEFAAQRKSEWDQQVANVQAKASDSLDSKIQQVSRTVMEETAPAFDVMDNLSSGDAFGGEDDVARPLISARNELAGQKQAAVGSAAETRPAPIGSANPFAADAAQKADAGGVSVPEPVFDDPSSFGEFSGRKPVMESSSQRNPFADMSTNDSTDVTPNPFDAFGSEGNSPAGSQTTDSPADSKEPAIDSGFSFDSGWRPSGAQHPNQR